MKKITELTIIVLASLAFNVSAFTIDAINAGTISIGDGVCYVNSYELMVKNTPAYEDRSILEFDISGISPDVTQVTFDMWYYNLDYPALPESTIDLFTYSGNGTVTTDDFYAGALFTSFTAGNNQEVYWENEYGDSGIAIFGYMRIDITSAVLDSLAVNTTYLGIRLSTTTSDRYNIGSMASFPDPVLVIPEPAMLLLLGLGGLLLKKKKRYSDNR